jgi:hypothetical protein
MIKSLILTILAINLVANELVYKEQYISEDAIKEMELQSPDKDFNLNELLGKNSVKTLFDEKNITREQEGRKERYLTDDEIESLKEK